MDLFTFVHASFVTWNPCFLHCTNLSEPDVCIREGEEQHRERNIVPRQITVKEYSTQVFKNRLSL